MAAPSAKHQLKSWVGLFQPLIDGAKKHDFRVLDRDFQVGDTVRLNEYEPKSKTYTGRTQLARITYITSGDHSPCAFSPFALHPGMVFLSLELIQES